MILASFFGCMVGMVLLALIAPQLAEFGLKFQSYEFFWLAVFGVVICRNLTAPKDPLKGWRAGFLGLFIATIGMEPNHAYPRFSFGSVEISGGIHLIPAMVGAFGFAEIITVMKQPQAELVETKLNRILPRIKDIAKVHGVRNNQLVGYGLVVGLNGTGDGNAPHASQSLRSMLSRLGVNIPADVNLSSKNVAAVAIHADLPAFAKPGQTLDITVSSIGNAKSLRGGSLLVAPLKGVDGQIYAIAQGNIVVSGFGAEGNDGSRVTVNVPSVGRIPNGAIVEKAVETPFGEKQEVVLNLRTPDFTTSNRVTQAINGMLGPGTAYSIDAGSINIQAPKDLAQRVAFISMLENIEIQPADPPARVIVNSRTGTVVIGQNVRVQPAAVSHGSLTVTITETATVSQPAALGQGQTVVVPSSDIEIAQENNRMFKLDTGVSLDDLVRAVNQVGAAPGDLVAILEALKEAGALRAELIVI